MSQSAERKAAATSTPRSRLLHVTICISAEHVVDWQVHKPSKFKLGPAFNAPSGWDPAERCLIEFQAKTFTFQHEDVPELG